MYLSRIELDQQNRNTMRLLMSPGNLHGAVEAAFPGPRCRKLWRLDRLQGKLYLMLVSESIPDFSNISQRYGNGDEGETRSYDSLLERLKEGSRWRFRLVANPTKSVWTGTGERGKVWACVSVSEQEEWLLKRDEKHGFHIEPDSLMVTESIWKIFEKGSEDRRRVSLKGTAFEGVLTVSDAERFRRTLCEGIGRGKAYGMGMLTIVRA